MAEGGGSQPGKLRVLALFNGATPDAVLGVDQQEMGPLMELLELPADAAEVQVLHQPQLQDLPRLVQEGRPNLVYVYGGAPGQKQDIERQSVSPLPFLYDAEGALLDASMQLFLSAFDGSQLEAVYLDFPDSAQLAVALRSRGVPHVLAWPADVAPPVLAGMDFAHCFFGMLRSGTISIPEAYAMAAHMARAHCSVLAGDELSEAAVPQLVSGSPATLPDVSTVPPLVAEGMDLSGGLAAAFPGYADLRLLAPNAELRLLQAGVSAMVNPHHLRFVGESLRAVLATEVRRLELLQLTPCDKTPAHLPAGSGAMRCEVRTPGGARCTVTLGGPMDVLRNKPVVEHALRQSMAADAHTLQFKVPPPEVPPPPTHVSPAVAGGTPVVEGLAVTSVWCVQMLKLLAQEAGYRGLALLGLAAVSSSPVAGFTAADAARLTTAVMQNDPAKAQPGAAADPSAADPSAADPSAAAAAAAAGQPAAAAEAASLPTALAAAARPPLPPSAPAASGVQPMALDHPPLPQANGTPAAGLAAMGSSVAALAAAAPAAAAATAVAAASSLQPGLSSAAPSGATLPAGSGLGGGSVLGGGGGGGSSGVPGAAAAGGEEVGRAGSPPEQTSADLKPSLNIILQQQALMQQQALIQQQQQQLMQQHVAAGGPLPWKSSRPPLTFCSEEQFYSDLIAFLTDRQGRQIDPRTFPEAILNGGKLDLYHLYKEVCSRGGYKVGNGINWKGQVFPRMRNFTANHKMTGVGNALKRHYQVYLLEYEQAHPEDVTGDRCSICGRGDEHANDWISCDMCDCWVHFSCDTRQNRGSFKDYSRGQGRLYHCPRCSEVRRHQTLQAQTAAAQVAQAAVAAQMAAAVQQLQQRQQAAAAVAAAAAAASQQQQQQQQQQQVAGLPPGAAAAAAGDGPALMQE